ncbi:hypothetical protein H6G81_31710 [Scytonema hofmannii FACHB-248]|uniref:Uncharacterized protein n=1 Tax=Scytonema hofmannii FACHB-248 TaxID=1842502 RepID=A0ABR8GZI0_9CYAN|nr:MULTISPECIES: hypothetical protein [Nostocales]MBD2608966.1 hypothetical protein [Scytonema hofmannii FACHB-248]
MPRTPLRSRVPLVEKRLVQRFAHENRAASPRLRREEFVESQQIENFWKLTLIMRVSAVGFGTGNHSQLRSL